MNTYIINLRDKFKSDYYTYGYSVSDDYTTITNINTGNIIKGEWRNYVIRNAYTALSSYRDYLNSKIEKLQRNLFQYINNIKYLEYPSFYILPGNDEIKNICDAEHFYTSVQKWGEYIIEYINAHIVLCDKLDYLKESV